MIDISKKDYAWSYAGTILSVSVNVIILPFVLYFLSSAELGMWYVFASINVLVSLLDFGFNATITRNVAYAWSGAGKVQAVGVSEAQPGSLVDMGLFCTVLKTCKAVYLVVSLIAAVLMVTAGSAYVQAITAGDSSAPWMAAWLVYCVGVFLNMFYGYATAYLRGVGAIAENYKAVVFSKVTQLVLTVGSLAFGFGLLGTSAAFLASCLVLRLLLVGYFNRYENIGSRVKAAAVRVPPDKVLETFKAMWHNAWRDGLVTLAIFLSTQANTLICSYVLGLSSTGSYGLAVQISTVVASCASVWYTTVQPKIQGMVVKGDNRAIADMFSESMLIYAAVSIVAYALFVLVGPPIIGLFKSDFEMDIGMLFFVCLYTFVYRGVNQFASLISNYNTIPYMPAFVVTSVASTALSFACAQWLDFGLWSLIIPPLAVMLVYNAWKWPMEALRIMGTTLRSFARSGYEGISARFRPSM